MKRRSFLKKSAIAAGAASLAVPAIGGIAGAAPASKSVFEIRVYHVSRTANAKTRLEQYFTEALIPFLNKHSVKVGAFTDYSLEEPVRLTLILAYPDASAWANAKAGMLTNAEYLKATISYNAIPAAEAVYLRYETFLLEGFDRFPSVIVPAEKKGLYEMRTYEGASEDAVSRKVKMFNSEEIDLFLKVGLQPVFFGQIVAGEYMPALTYMVGFRDMADRDATWAKFGGSEEWKTMSSKPEYANSVSNIRRIFLVPTPYSQF
jgi:hypothetical protein